VDKWVEWITANWQWILVGVTVAIALLKRYMEGTLQEFLAEAIGALIDLAEGEVDKITEEQVKMVARWIYGKLPLPDLLKAIFTEEMAEALLWKAWQWYLENREANVQVLSAQFARMSK